MGTHRCRSGAIYRLSEAVPMNTPLQIEQSLALSQAPFSRSRNLYAHDGCCCVDADLTSKEGDRKGISHKIASSVADVVRGSSGQSARDVVTRLARFEFRKRDRIAWCGGPLTAEVPQDAALLQDDSKGAHFGPTCGTKLFIAKIIQGMCDCSAEKNLYDQPPPEHGMQQKSGWPKRKNRAIYASMVGPHSTKG